MVRPVLFVNPSEKLNKSRIPGYLSTVGDHGLLVLSSREGYGFGNKIMSDVAPLNKVILRLLGEVGGIVAMKDPPKGGLSNALNEWSQKSKVGILSKEEKIPI